MELETEFRYPNVIDFFGTTLFHLCHFTTLDLHNYAAYNKYSENNIENSNDKLCDEINKRLKKTVKSIMRTLLIVTARRFRSLVIYTPLCIERQW